MVLLALLLAAAPPAARPDDVSAQLAPLLGVPYVNDEVLDETGRWTFFAHPEKTAPGEGLNCSGFVVTATRKVLGHGLTLAEATHDRLGDSGDDAPLGKDWDFGWDLVMNLSEGRARRVILPEGAQAADALDARAQRGFLIADQKAWKKVFAQLKPEALYLADLSRTAKRLEHHHVALVVRDAAGKVWFYQTLPKGHSHRLELTSSAGFERMKGMFGATVKVLLIEVALTPAPDAGSAPPKAEDGGLPTPSDAGNFTVRPDAG